MESPSRLVRAPASLLVPCLVILTRLLAVPAESPRTDSRSEYFERLAKVPPRDAEAYVQLGLWCQAAGLQDEARKCFQEAIAIDEDCEKARVALGYRRHGVDWARPGEKPPRRVAPRTGSAAARKLVTPAINVAPTEAKKLPPGDGTPASAKPESPGAASETQPSSDTQAPSPTPGPGAKELQPKDAAADARGAGGLPIDGPEPSGPPAADEKKGPAAGALDAEIERKKAWAAQAAEKIAATFVTYEDNDFLIHSSLPLQSREMKTMVKSLKTTRGYLAKLVGATTATRIWPGKLQFVLLKSEPDYERFADMVDGFKSSKNPEGAYMKDDHVVVLNPESDLFPRVLGETAFKKLNGSDRYVGWWIPEGVGELLFAQSPGGVKAQHYAQSMRVAAEFIAREGLALKIFNLVEIAEYKAKDFTRNRALAMSLVDYLVKKRSLRGFQDLVQSLKSDKAPPPPATPQEFSSFFLTYKSFQEESIKAAFKVCVDAMDEKWKAYVLSVAGALKDDEARRQEEAKKAVPTKKKR